MSVERVAYMPLPTYPESPPDTAVTAAVDFALGLGFSVQATAFAADIPQVAMPLGGFVLNVPELVRTTEERSFARCEALAALVRSRAKGSCAIRKVGYGALLDTIAAEARYFDLALLPWSPDSPVVRDVGQSLVFGAGRPTLLVPASAQAGPASHVAVAWDGSRVAARALGDIMPLLADGARLTVLTVRDEKALAEGDIAAWLASALAKRGWDAHPVGVALNGRTIAAALQEGAVEAGATMLAMGGFGHSRLRDFILGGATRGVFDNLRLPVLISH